MESIEPKINLERITTSKVPIGVKIIAILGLISSAINLIGGLIYILNPFNNNNGTVGEFIFTTILLILAFLVNFFICNGLLKGKNWARNLTLLALSVLIIDGFISQSVIVTFVGFIMIIYLVFNPAVKSAFKRK